MSPVHELLHSFYSRHCGGATPRIVDLHGAGGFSGAHFWRVETAGPALCLRRWPTSDMSRGDHLRWTHQVLADAYEAGCDFLPVPLAAANGQTLIAHGGHLWQLERWLPGRADFAEQPSPQRLESALHAVATFHNVTRQPDGPTGVPPSISHRLHCLNEWFSPQDGRPSPRLKNLQTVAPGHPFVGDLAVRILRAAPPAAELIRAELQRLSAVPRLLQPVIGDLWHDHLLFEGERLSGIVDFGAMKIDHPALDLGRLVGSLAGDDTEFRERIVGLYRQTATLSADEQFLADGYDRSATLVSSLNWLQWICVEQRTFEQPNVVRSRIERITGRLENLAARR